MRPPLPIAVPPFLPPLPPQSWLLGWWKSLLGLGLLWTVSVCFLQNHMSVCVCLYSIYLSWVSSGLETDGVLWFLCPPPFPPPFFG